MLTVAFRWEVDEELGDRGLTIRVDGVPLREIIEETEARFPDAGDVAGDYAGIVDWQLTSADHFLGGPGSDLGCGAPTKTVLLGCSCGETGCWPLMARVEADERLVRWSGFEQPFRPEWDYGALAFTFDRGQYEAALRSVF